MTKRFFNNWVKVLICYAMAITISLTGINTPNDVISWTISAQAASVRQCYLIGTSNVRAYSNAGLTNAIGWIYPTDLINVITVTDKYSYGYYPIGGGKVKYAYFATSAILCGTTGNSYKNNTGSFRTFIRPNGNQFGTCTKGDTVTILGVSGNYTQIKYPVGQNYKYAFALTSDVNRYLLNNTTGTVVSGGSGISSTQAKAILFNATYYANKYPDLKAAFGYDEVKLYNHYCSFGKKEGRSASPIFDPVYYLNNNSDLKRAFGNNYVAAYNHLVSFGLKEGRKTSMYYEGYYYKSRYSDLQKAYFSSGSSASAYYNLAKHYLTWGYKEKRWANSNGYIPDGMEKSGNIPSNQITNNTLCSPVPAGCKFSKQTKDGSWYGYHDINRGVSSSTPVYAICDGKVTYKQAYTYFSGVKKLTSYGNFIEFTSANNQYTAKYCHLSKFVGANQIISSNLTVQRSGSSGVYTITTRTVRKGEIIGYIGTTGNSSGIHLHFELRKNGTRINPTSVIGGLI